MPGSGIQVGGGVGIGAVREATVAIVKIATRVTEEILVFESVSDISVVGEAVAENDHLAEDRYCLGKELRDAAKESEDDEVKDDSAETSRYSHVDRAGCDSCRQNGALLPEE